MFHIDVYHRHAENVLSRVDIACGHIPAEIGHPKDASGRHCVLSLCHLMYCHLPNISPWRLRRFTKSHSKPIITTYPATALCTCTFKIIKQLVTELFYHSLCVRSSLHSTPCHPHHPFQGPLANAVHRIHGSARCKEPLHDGGVVVVPGPVQRCPTSGAEGLREPPLAVGETAICVVKSLSFIFFKLV